MDSLTRRPFLILLIREAISRKRSRGKKMLAEGLYKEWIRKDQMHSGNSNPASPKTKLSLIKYKRKKNKRSQMRTSMRDHLFRGTGNIIN